ncbi:hypothetical protein [Lentzea sp. NPDC060358]|uniref:hypothetical protein n=1 Tax=Lentzea sp. NPDC060358 TaxID=3347103 RepID=UPI00365034A3
MATREVVRRATAVLAGAGALAHLASALSTSDLLLGVMGVLCLPCAVHLWKHDSRRSLALVAFGAIGMVAAHLALLAPAAPSHQHGAAFQPATHVHDPALLVLLVALECAVVAGVWWVAPSAADLDLTGSTA